MVSPRKNETIATSGTEPTPGALGVPEKTRGPKGSAAALHILHRFGERVDDEPEHAPYFPQEIAARVTDSLHDEDRIGLNRLAGIATLAVLVSHGHGEVASVP